MKTFREFIALKEDNTRQALNQRAYLNTQNPAGEFNPMQSMGKNIAKSAGGAALDMAADMVPGGNVLKAAGTAAYGVAKDYFGTQGANMARNSLMQKYNIRPEAMNLDPRISGLLSQQAMQAIGGQINNEAVVKQFMQKTGSVPFDYANQVAMKYIVQAFQGIRQK